MNTERVLAVADFIEREVVGFDMSSFIERRVMPLFPEAGVECEPCGTTACIAGSAFMLKHGVDAVNDAIDAKGGSWSGIGLFGEEVSQGASEYLDLDVRQTAELFYTFGHDRAQAVRTLRHLAATGVVNWRA